MPLSRKPINVLEGLFRGGHVTIDYTFDNSGHAAFHLTKHDFELGLFQQTLDVMSRKLPQTFKIIIKPRPARGRAFTTGNAELDRITGDALTLIELSCRYTGSEVQVTKTSREHSFVLPAALAHISTVQASQPHGAFRNVGKVTLSTRGVLTIGTLS